MSSLTTVLVAFIAAKSVLLLIVLGTTYLDSLAGTKWPFGYDTSAEIVLAAGQGVLGRVLGGLFRWDTVYFTALAEEGYLFEQEWAFGPLWPATIRSYVPCMTHEIRAD
jgi:GPI mannosyltransferase 2